MQQETLQKEEFLQNVFDAIPALIFIVDDDVKIFHLNSTASKMLGAIKEFVYKKEVARHYIVCIQRNHPKDAVDLNSASLASLGTQFMKLFAGIKSIVKVLGWNYIQVKMS